MTGPLCGLRIVEISSYVATPLCGLALRQLGADVIRVEPAGGAPDRGRFPRSPSGESLYWSGLNAGKRDLELDLRDPAARAFVADLICSDGPDGAQGALVVSNTERYHELSYESLRVRRPDLIHVVLSGASDGSSAVDYTVQAGTGFAAVTGPRDFAAPTNSVVPAWDIAAGLYLATGLLAAYVERVRTGRGQQVKLALEDVALSTAGILGYLAEAQLGGTSREPAGNEVYGTFGRDFVSSDGVRFMLVLLTTGHWRRFLDAARLTEAMRGLEGALGADFDDEAQRFRHRRVLAAVVDEWCEARTWEQVEKVLARSRVLASPYRTFSDLVADDAKVLAESSLFSLVTQPGAGTYWAPGSPLVMGGRQTQAAPAPALGQDSEQLITSLGYDVRTLAVSHANGATS